MSEEYIKEICEMYSTYKYTIRFLSEKFSITPYRIGNVLKKHGIPIKRINLLNNEINEDYFKEINTEEKAYILGFIFADGSIHKNQLSIEINIKDIEILEKIKQELRLNSKIYYRKRKTSELVCLSLHSQKIIDDLSKYGIIPDKTHVTNHLPIIDKAFLPHFLRGLIDGDGWITQDKDGYFHIGFCNNSQQVCQDFQNYCNSLIEKKSKAKILKPSKNAESYSCSFCGKEMAKQLATVLYKDNNICLSRKYKLAELIFGDKNDEDIV